MDVPSPTPPSEAAEVSTPLTAPTQSNAISRSRELLAAITLVVLCDLTIYRGKGFAGYAALFLLAPILLACGARVRKHLPKLLGLLLIVASARLLINGNFLLVASAAALVVAFTLRMAGYPAYCMNVVLFALQSVEAGYHAMKPKERPNGVPSTGNKSLLSMNYLLPVAVVSLFTLVFVLANPDLSLWMHELVDDIVWWIRNRGPDGWEVAFWVAVLWISMGFMRPILSRTLFTAKDENITNEARKTADSEFYRPFHNMLVAVVVLFAAYLIFEFSTLWFRAFPPGFYYSGYAHKGAAWLTVALALATAILSLVFHGTVLDDPRLSQLRKLAWIWSVENFVLAIAVYHRMHIYIEFNGMTRMRTVAFYGMTAVLIGFLLVVRKINRGHNFIWLVRRHTWTLALIVFAYSVTPVDWLVVRYNVWRIQRGDPKPSVEISVHPIDFEGITSLIPLLDAEDTIIREGVSAMLADGLAQLENFETNRKQRGWTAFQFAHWHALGELRRVRDRLAPYDEPERRRQVLIRFHEYAYQWF